MTSKYCSVCKLTYTLEYGHQCVGTSTCSSENSARSYYDVIKIEALEAELSALKEENARLRKALEEIYEYNSSSDSWESNRARDALAQKD